MRHASAAACATVAWSAPVLVWVGAGLAADAAQTGGAARTAGDLAPLLAVVQMLALSLLVPALGALRRKGYSAAVAALIVTSCWPAAVLLQRTAGVGWTGLATGQAAVAAWAVLALSVTGLMAWDRRGIGWRQPLAQAVLVTGAVVLIRPLHAFLSSIPA